MELKGKDIVKDKILTAAILGLKKVDVGIASDTFLEKDGELVAVIEPKEIFNIENMRPKNWLIIDLETGSRGWYPGCKVIGTVNMNEAKILTLDNLEADVITTIPISTQIQILTILDNGLTPHFYKVKYNDIIGYIKSNYISNINYVDP